jgi:integral membrane protein
MNALPIRLLRKIGIAEGISFLFLLIVAMPLKYIYGLPLAVKYTGWAHGILFISYIGLAYYAKEVYEWTLGRFLLAFVSAWIPLGTFFFDKSLGVEEKRIKQGLR